MKKHEKSNWKTFFAASVWDGHACYVEHWTGEVNRKGDD